MTQTQFDTLASICGSTSLIAITIFGIYGIFLLAVEVTKTVFKKK